MENSTPLEEGTEAEETQQVSVSHKSLFNVHSVTELKDVPLFVAKEQPEKEKEKEVWQGVSLVSYRPFFRELDMEVLSVLQCGLLSRSLLDSELHTKVRKERRRCEKRPWTFHSRGLITCRSEQMFLINGEGTKKVQDAGPSGLKTMI